MKILFFTHYTALMGANRSLLTLLEGFIAKGAEVQVCVPAEGEVTAMYKQKGITYQVFPYGQAAWRKYSWRWLKAKSLFAKDQAVLEDIFNFTQTQFQPDIIYSNSSVMYIGAWLAERLGKPHVWHIREFGALDYNLDFYPSLDYFNTQLAKAKAIICISKAIQNHIGDKFKTQLIYNGVFKAAPVQKVAELSSNTTKPDFNFLIIGAIHPNKGQLEALRAFRKVNKIYPNTSLTIAGSGQKLYFYLLKLYTGLFGLNKCVQFTGYVSNPDKLYRHCDAVLMCSRYEAMGRVTVEAFAQSKPVIGLNSGGTPELIADGENGFIYNLGVDKLAEAMLRLVKDPALAQRMGQQGLESVKQRFSISQYVDAVWQVLQSL